MKSPVRELFGGVARVSQYDCLDGLSYEYDLIDASDASEPLIRR